MAHIFRQDNNLLTGLQHYWKFDGNSNDSIGTNNGVDTDVSYVPGKIADAFHPDNTLAYSVVGTVSLTTSYTISFWYKPGSIIESYHAILSRQPAHAGIYMYGFTGNTAIIFYEDNGGGYEISTYNLPVGVWTMCTLVVDNNIGVWYINGQKNSNSFQAIDIVVDTFGMSHPSFNANGDIDECGIWNRALSSNDISNLYNNGYGTILDQFNTSQTKVLLTSNSLVSDLISYYKMDGNSNDSLGINDGVDTNITYSSGAGIINQGASYSVTSTISTNGDLLNSLNKVSFSFWNKSPDYLFPIFFLKNFSFDIRYDGSSQYGIQLKVYNSDGTDFCGFRNSTGTMTPGTKWSHIVVTFDGTQISDLDKVKIYIDGVSQTVVTFGFISSPSSFNNITNNLFIGSNLNGSMDEIGIWGKILTQVEVTKLYNSGKGFQYPFLTNILKSNPFVLDKNRNAMMAFSVRKLNSQYDGYCMRVRRDSDNTEMDIGFNYLSSLDTTTLLNFVGTYSGYVTKWYDQTNNGYDMFNTTLNQQPIIVSSSVLLTKNNKPAPFVVLGQFLHLPTNVLIGKEYSFHGVIEWTQYGKEWLGATSGNMYGIYNQGPGTVYHNSTINPDPSYWIFGGFAPINTRNILQLHRNQSNGTLFINGTRYDTTQQGGFNLDFSLYSLYSEVAGNYSDGYLQETIIYNTYRISENDSIYQNQKNYFS